MQFIFRLYHSIDEKEVTDIFRSFPYLYLCEQHKVQKFMGEFRKYRMTKEQIIKLVSATTNAISLKLCIVSTQWWYSCKQDH